MSNRSLPKPSAFTILLEGLQPIKAGLDGAGTKMLEAAQVDRAPIHNRGFALAALVVLCLIVYAAVGVVGRFISR